MERTPRGPGNWLITYSDFITLMLTFFIVLYILTPGVEEEKFTSVINSFKGHPGVLKGGVQVLDDVIAQKKRRARHWNQLRGTVEQQNLEDQIKVDLLPEGVRIVLGEAITFNSGSAELLDEGKPVLNSLLHQLSVRMSDEIAEIEILGHTDDVPISENSRLYNSNWELGSDRANSVLEYVLVNSELPDKFLKVGSYGEYRPRFENNSPLNRKRNRRVEIFVRYKTIDPDGTTASDKDEVAYVTNENY